ncbi:MAG: hypothetical protein HGB31_04330 [Erysipelotrichaceae bacterium]|nr:hypothetical protein [Erysipelotrichaceae bacterium]
MIKRLISVLMCSLLLLSLSACDPTVNDPGNDPFVLGVNKITEVNINMKMEAIVLDTALLDASVLQTDSWIKTSVTILDETTLKMIFLDDQAYEYKVYRQYDKYIVTITNPKYTKVHRYWISETIMMDIVQYLTEHYLTQVAGYLDFKKAYWGTDESTVFEIDQNLIKEYYLPRDFQIPAEPIDLSRRHAEFSLVDELGNVYNFYAQAYAVVITWAKDNTSVQYSFDFEKSANILKVLTENYYDEPFVGDLEPVLFTHVYLEGIDSYNSSKMVSISKIISDGINEELMLQRAFKADLLPDDQSKCQFVLKDDTGLFYVVCYNPYIVGVGLDPKGPLTYYSLGDFNDTDIGGYLAFMPLPAPTGSRIDNLRFTKVYAVMHCDCDHHVDLSLAQSNYVNSLMDLKDHASVVTDFSLYSNDTWPDDLFYIDDTNGHRIKFLIYPMTKKIIISIDYNGEDQYGMTYYEIDEAGYEKVLESHFYLSGLLDPNKKDANPTFTGFYIGNVLGGSTAIIDLPITTLTNTQITTIDGLLQRSQWQELSLYDDAIPIDSDFILQKSSDAFYIFSKVGSISVITERQFNGEAKVYLIPNSAYNDALSKLNSYK